jgi:hypothetical protein
VDLVKLVKIAISPILGKGLEAKDQKKKPYSPPTLTKRTLEQAKKLVVADRKNAAKKKPPTS